MKKYFILSMLFCIQYIVTMNNDLTDALERQKASQKACSALKDTFSFYGLEAAEHPIFDKCFLQDTSTLTYEEMGKIMFFREFLYLNYEIYHKFLLKK